MKNRGFAALAGRGGFIVAMLILHGAAAAADAQPGTGEIEVAPFLLPPSSFSSPEAQAALVEMQQSARAQQNQPPGGALERRARREKELQPALEAAQRLYPVTIAAQPVAGVPVDEVLPSSGVARRNRGRVLIELAGGDNINGANSTFAYPELSGEQVLVANPQYIIVGTGYGLNVSSYSSAPFWSQLGAVQHGNVTGMNSNWMTEPDPTMLLEGLPAMIAILHPAA